MKGNREHVHGPAPRAIIAAAGPNRMATIHSNEAARWEAVNRRAHDTDFFYAVRTTGVFCHPDCPARRPRPENVEFFATSAEAIRAGYRPCKRCRPCDTGRGGERMVEACRLLSRRAPTTTREVARDIGLSDSYFQRVFKKELGVTPQQYRRRVLAERARATLTSSGSVTASVYEAGYSSSSRFYDGVGRELGMKPSAARLGGPGEEIRYWIARCSLGCVLVAWTTRGVCQVALGDDAASLLEALETRFYEAVISASESCKWVEAVVEAVERPAPVAVPLDIRGTAFQERVWQALRTVPPGRTVTYSEVAAAVGQPAAARAVAHACASNELAVVVPCHRVVRKDGHESGYRWGLVRKAELLRREKLRGDS